MLTTAIKTKERKNKGFRIDRSCCYGGWKQFSSDACMPPCVVSDAALIGLVVLG